MTTPTTFLLCACDRKGRSHDGKHQWPLEVGATVTAPEFEGTPHINRLYGLLHGAGNFAMTDAWRERGAKWYVLEVQCSHVRTLNGCAAVSNGVVRFVGPMPAAAKWILRNDPQAAAERVTGLSVKGGSESVRSAGNLGRVQVGSQGVAVTGTRGVATAGCFGTAIAGNHGTAVAGDYGVATAGLSGRATAGFGGRATAGQSGVATTGERGISQVGALGKAAAGSGGLLILAISGAANSHKKYVTASVDVNGIDPDTYYMLDGANRIVPAPGDTTP